MAAMPPAEEVRTRTGCICVFMPHRRQAMGLFVICVSLLREVKEYAKCKSAGNEKASG